MNRDKQIEEMGNEIQKAVNGCASYWSRLIAEHLTTKGYRKASDLAREIFEEIEKLLFKNSVFIHIQSYNELKNKYTEGEG